MTEIGSRRNRTRIRSLFALSAVVLFLLGAADCPAQRLPPEQLKDGKAVRNAFKSVVAESSRSTVRVLSEGKEVALGAIVGADGWVLTKASVLKSKLACRFKDERLLDARFVGIHKDFDLAMLKVEAADLPTVHWADGKDPAVGAWLATPGTGEVPIAVGIVSVGRRKIPPQRGVLGISIAEDKPGPRITHVFPNSGADKAGLKVGDIITQVAGKVVKTSVALAAKLKTLRPGDSLTLRVMRGDERVDLQATLSYPLTSILNRGMLQNRIGGELSMRRAGFPVALEHDTVLRPQDCGGPVVDLSGDCIGINIARAGRTETFAVPAGDVVGLIEKLKSGKLAPTVLKD